ncbi:MAG: hypothetical protein RL026_1661 [Pseudomonadota bacterium]|jgi:hypothetical protein
MSERPATVAAGAFLSWLHAMRAALRGTAGTEVPCGDCVGCCVSGYAVRLRPEDARARALIAAEHQRVRDDDPPGHAWMPALANGLCPMQQAGACSIYDQRPQTCRDYDCRIFAAAGVLAGGDDRSVINRRVTAWRFDLPTPEDAAAATAVRAAARFIREHADAFPGGRAPTSPTGVAVLAVKTWSVFREPMPHGTDPRTVARAIIDTSRRFDAGLDD